MTHPFRFDTEVADPGRVCVVTLAGRLDPLAVPDFEAALAAFLASGHRRFVLDLAGLQYVGSLGLRSLVGLANKVRGEGVVCLAAPTEFVRSALEITRLTALMKVFPTRADALDAART